MCPALGAGESLVDGVISLELRTSNPVSAKLRFGAFVLFAVLAASEAFTAFTAVATFEEVEDFAVLLTTALFLLSFAGFASPGRNTSSGSPVLNGQQMSKTSEQGFPTCACVPPGPTLC